MKGHLFLLNFTLTLSAVHRSDRHPHAGASSPPPRFTLCSSLISKLTCPLALFVHVLPLSGGVFHETWLKNMLSVASNKQWKDSALRRQTAPVKHMTWCATLQNDRSQTSRDLRGRKKNKKQERILVQTSGLQAETKFVHLNFLGLLETWNTEQCLG